MLNRTGDVKTCIIADYNIAGISSRRGRQPHEQRILDAHHEDIRVIELVGALSFATIDYVTRQFGTRPSTQLLIVDFRRAPAITTAGARLLADSLGELMTAGGTAILAGVESTSVIWQAIAPCVANLPKLRRFALLDDAIEWAEDQLIYRYGGFAHHRKAAELSEQALLDGLNTEELDEIARRGRLRAYETGQRVVHAGEPAASLFFLQAGMVSVKLPSGVRLATLTQGMEFGEMALIEDQRTADVFADTPVTCLELSLQALTEFSDQNPRAGQRIVRNLAVLLAKRLILANTKVELLAAY
jgi:glutaminase